MEVKAKLVLEIDEAMVGTGDSALKFVIIMAVLLSISQVIN